MKSKEDLFADLAALLPDHFAEAPKQGLKHRALSNETYGKRSFIYVGCPSHKERNLVEDELVALGYGVNFNYGADGYVAEVEVAYFKGFHWNE